ncbi:class I SAM-dependent methyltransferase [Streptomyces paludis]|uniref:Class I SAM-dependent methyltransferase n=1 Tax=Streptomyces paludis TaxID=2282738 RepID=A0A345HNI5_9ACTN|nr:class I SAM-dependent methyltransferase [Streptomyces paludis]AXG78259.1 class I SAM-dependent methyltransferase [Streptomyces paludis]
MTTVDRAFAEPRLAALYDLFSPEAGRGDFTLYLPLVMSARSVLDIGCGTGQLLHRARENGHPGRLCGLDPAAGMLEVARKTATATATTPTSTTTPSPEIEWIQGDLSTAPAWRDTFDLAVMTGHAFQALLTDAEIHTALTAVAAALTPDGTFAFETRNPSAREWEDWHLRYSGRVTDPTTGATVENRCEVIAAEGDRVTFTHTYTSPTWDTPQQSRSTLRFLTPEALTTALTAAGLTITAQYGDWDHSPLTTTGPTPSPEIITLARRV